MKITPKTDKELAEANLMPEGIYDFEIGTAEDAISKNTGNEMIKVDLTVFDEKGGKRFIFDYLMEAMPHKLKHAAQACGLEAEYNAGTLSADDFIGKCGKIKIKIQKDKNGIYADKNTVQDYVVPGGTDSEKAKVSKAKVDKASVEDDSIPF